MAAEIPIPSYLQSSMLDTATSDISSPLEAEVIDLFDAYRDRLFRYVLSFGLTSQDSDDIVQEVFLALFRHLQLRRSRSNLRGWIFRVAHNLSLKRRMNCHRQTGISNKALLETCPDPNPDPEQHLIFQERQIHLLAIVRALPEKDERCLRLRAEGLKYREIAEVLEMSLGAVSMALTRSLSRLKSGDLG